MNNEELKRAVRSAAYEIRKNEGVISPVNMFMKIGVLAKKDYEDWRMGRVSYLERVCHANLNKLGTAMKELRKYAVENNLRPSKTVYMKWGKGRKVQLRFSKYNNPKIEEAYSTHFVDKVKVEAIKQTKRIKETRTTELIPVTGQDSSG